MNCKTELRNFIEHSGWDEFEEALEILKEEQKKLDTE